MLGARIARSEARPSQLGFGVETDAAVAAFVAFLLPLLLWTAGLAGLNRLSYPLTSLVAAVYLYRRGSPWFLGLCFWLFCASPFVRRITDFQAGWDPSNPVLLAPYLACSVCSISFLRYVSREKPPFVVPFATLLICVAYGTVLALLNGRVASGLIDALRWSAGPFCAVHVLREKEMQPQIQRAVFASLIVAGPLMAIYGIAQFLDPSAWDREWMTNVQSLGFDSIGQPAPFEVRVFSVLNSPASLAMFLIVDLIVFLNGPPLIAIPGIALMAICLALTQYRAGWGGLAFGLVCLMLIGSSRERLRLAVAGIALFIFAGSLSVVPEISTVISDRAATLTRLNEDTSGQDRLSQYADFLQHTDGLVLGQGLALAGASRQLDGKQPIVIDGGVMEPILAFGVFGGTAFLAAVVGLVVMMFRGRRGGGPIYAIYCAGCAACFVQLPFARVLIGEGGFLGWLFLGLALGDVLLRRNPRSHRRAR